MRLSVCAFALSTRLWMLGTVEEALERGAAAFMRFNHPADILITHLERCRHVHTNPRVTALDLCCGLMAVAGSTRMQATTSEQLIAGGALENVLIRILSESGGSTLPREFSLCSKARTSAFESMLDALVAPESLQVMADHIEFEEALTFSVKISVLLA